MAISKTPVEVRRTLVFAGAITIAIASSIFSSTASAQTPRMCGGMEATIVGTAGNDLLTGTEGNDVIAGLQGNDYIFGLEGDDIICGGQGDDTLYGGPGFDTIYGAQGNDWLFASFSHVDGSDTAGSRMFGGAGDDFLFGSERWDRMQGGPGADTMRGLQGRDWMRGGRGNDTIDGGDWRDDLHGGDGADRLILTNGDTARGGSGIDTCVVSSSTTTTRSCVVERTPLLDGIPVLLSSLRAGDCVLGAIPPRSPTAMVTKIDCDEPHDFELFREALLSSDIDTYDANAIAAYAEPLCQISLVAYVGGETTLRTLVVQPTEQSFNDLVEPDRIISCLLFAEGEQLVGRAN